MKTTDFAKYLSSYLSRYLPEQRNLSFNTICSYSDTFRLLLMYCKNEKGLNVQRLSMAQLDNSFISGFLCWLEKERKNSVATINHRLIVIRAFFDYIQIEQPALLLECQKIRQIPLRKAPKPGVTYLTVDALQALFAEPDSSVKKGRRDLVLLTLLYDSAVRVQELADLCIGGIRLDPPATITVWGKGRKKRSIPLMKQTVVLLRKFIVEEKLNTKEHSDFPLFRNKQGQKFTRAGIAYILNKYVKIIRKKGIAVPPKVTPHVLRHTKAMHLLKAGVNLIYIRDFLGHVDVKTTEIYATPEFESKRTALEQASKQIKLPIQVSWEFDTDLIDWLSNLCSRK